MYIYTVSHVAQYIILLNSAPQRSAILSLCVASRMWVRHRSVVKFHRRVVWNLCVTCEIGRDLFVSRLTKILGSYPKRYIIESWNTHTHWRPNFTVFGVMYLI